MNVEQLWIGNDLLKGAWVNMQLQVWGCWKILNFGFGAGELVENLLCVLQIILGDIRNQDQYIYSIAYIKSNMYHVKVTTAQTKNLRDKSLILLLITKFKLWESRLVWMYVTASDTVIWNQKEINLLCRWSWWSRNLLVFSWLLRSKLSLK